MAERYLDRLIEQGYSQIVVTYRSALEEKDRMYGGWDRETIVIVAQTPHGEFVQISCIIYQVYNPHSRSETPTTTVITAEEHAAAFSNHVRYDNPPHLQQLAQKREEAEKREAYRQRVQAWVTKNRPNCPKCNRPMLVCSGEKVNFWGCRSFPKCKSKVWMDNPHKHADFCGVR